MLCAGKLARLKKYLPPWSWSIYHLFTGKWRQLAPSHLLEVGETKNRQWWRCFVGVATSGFPPWFATPERFLPKSRVWGELHHGEYDGAIFLAGGKFVEPIWQQALLRPVSLSADACAGVCHCRGRMASLDALLGQWNYQRRTGRVSNLPFGANFQRRRELLPRWLPPYPYNERLRSTLSINPKPWASFDAVLPQRICRRCSKTGQMTWFWASSTKCSHALQSRIRLANWKNIDFRFQSFNCPKIISYSLNSFRTVRAHRN